MNRHFRVIDLVRDRSGKVLSGTVVYYTDASKRTERRREPLVVTPNGYVSVPPPNVVR